LSRFALVNGTWVVEGDESDSAPHKNWCQRFLRVVEHAQH